MLENIKVNMIDDPEVDIREAMDKEGIEELAESIKNVGLIQPIIVFKKNDRYEVVVGHRRLIACRYAKLEKINAMVLKYNSDKMEIMKIDENIMREAISPIETAKYIYRIREEKKMSTTETAKFFRKTPQWVNAMLRLLDLDEYTTRAVDRGAISYQGALELQKVKDDNHRTALTKAAVESGAHTRTINNWVKQNEIARESTYNERTEEKKTEQEQKPIVYKKRCIVCNELVEAETLISVDVCPKCLPILKVMSKTYREG